jgi:hypothetical protein
MAKKLNQKLLNEELKKFRLLSEYSFYMEEPKKNDDDLILGSNLEEADEEPVEEPTDDSKTAQNTQDDSENTFGTDDTGGEQADAATDDSAADTGAETKDTETMDAETPDTGGEGEVEVDVTQIVKGSEEAQKAASDASQKTSELLAKFSELEQRVAAMDSISSKIQDLEKEIVKRNPTPVEKIEMRSMHSFPYNIKLTDYWKDVEGYDVNDEKKPEEYILKKDDIDTGYVDTSIKKTFDVPEDYEEEDIQS